MKSLFLSMALLLGLSATLFADRPTQSQNSTAIASGRSTLSTQATSLQGYINNKNISAAQTAAASLLTTMKSGLYQTYVDMTYGGAASSKHTKQNYGAMEMAVYDFQKLMADIANNGSTMMQKVTTFSNYY